jgi:hypothetical protein
LPISAGSINMSACFVFANITSGAISYSGSPVGYITAGSPTSILIRSCTGGSVAGFLTQTAAGTKELYISGHYSRV